MRCFLDTDSCVYLPHPMTINRTNCRADTSRVTEVLSEPEARPVTATADEPFTRITPEQVARMGKTTAILQEVRWETHDGVHGPATLMKRVKHETMMCPDCEVPGRYDNSGEIICPEDCGRILSDTPLMLPEDHFNQRTSGGGGRHGKPALNPAQDTGPSEPNVQ